MQMHNLQPSSTLLSLQLGNHYYDFTKRPINTFGKPPSFLIVHSSEHYNWGRQLAQHLRNDLLSFFPEQENIKIEELVISGSREQIQSTVLTHPGIMAPKKERFTHIITPDFWETVQIQSLRYSSGLDIPQLYCLPGGLHHTQSVGIDGERSAHMNGVYSEPLPYDEYLTCIKALIGNLSRVCVVSGSGRGGEGVRSFLNEQRTLLQVAADSKNIELIDHYWTTHDFGETSLRRVLPSVEAVITLRDPAVAVHHNNLMRVCVDNRTPLCASELDSVFSGAAIGYGNAGSFYSALIIRLALQSAMLKKPLHQLEHQQLPEQKIMRYNPHTLSVQGVKISPEKKALLEVRSIFDDIPVEYNNE